MNENKFNGMGKIYSKYRPSYPFDFIDYLFTDVGISQRSIIADIGSGTGILTRQLLEKGSKVYGIEPNADMRDIAETNLNNFLGFTSVNGNAENTTIDDNSVDYITVAQAFHWFDRERFKK
ncbi:class I SAM-dependent methyltransferase [Romboutsia sp. 1001216sp1]|nr:class I SAM-dependent methyltransferase [Romboutsia sp. 1001216sp1]MDB8805765.1 class I SAM-dependent methyltransferase [Romboutsia sp. 1001216sp1]MDB8808249.1 class I SAM-dependent methyltransferase [Romboutsia sp. 1001216sp1]MDB8811518.1 class I SAM-dependent methyltransferase [Romboutsia sp. 1001216sp1]MDB8817223.1 class I SAM-dependent methyltransferase [Romboutsia sp. 1001216sp1]MDB8819822.1 class I SAM-dependent methyltransferase [Romboutsia sp. 1001216sp1]